MTIDNTSGFDAQILVDGSASGEVIATGSLSEQRKIELTAACDKSTEVKVVLNIDAGPPVTIYTYLMECSKCEETEAGG